MIDAARGKVLQVLLTGRFEAAEREAWWRALRDAAPEHAWWRDDAPFDPNTIAAAVVANSPEALAAYKDLYRNGQDRGMTDALQFEYDTQYPMSGAGEPLPPPCEYFAVASRRSSPIPM